MKSLKLMLLGGIALFAGGSLAQGQTNKYLDDAYYSRKDIAKIEAEQKQRAQERRLEWERLQQAEKARREAELAEYKKRRHSYEIDAYNGHLQIEDDEAQGEDYAYARERRPQDNTGVYGEYSDRLHRFHGRGNTIIINNPDRVYLSGGYDTSWGYYDRPYLSGYWGSYSSWYPRYDSFYDPYYYSRWSYSPYRWGYAWGGYYDPWYDSYYSGYYSGFYGNYHPYYYGGIYDGYYGYYRGYYTGVAARANYEHYYNNPYSHGGRSGSGNIYRHSERNTAYGAYSTVRDYNNYSQGYSRENTSGYRGSARGSYSGQGYQQGNQSNRSYNDNSTYQPARQEPTRSYNDTHRSAPSRVETPSPAPSNNNSGGGGGGYRPRERSR